MKKEEIELTVVTEAGDFGDLGMIDEIESTKTVERTKDEGEE